MGDYYGHRHYGVPSYIYRPESSEYPGYDSSWVLGREMDASYYHGEHYHHPNYASFQYYPRSRSEYFLDSHTHADLAWATEIPVRLRVNLCCEGCKIKLDKSLRDLHGVHDVGISGWANALVTVTGTASPHKILKIARKATKSAELLDDHHSHGRY